MSSQIELDKLYLKKAKLNSELSRGIRLKVGAVCVTPSAIELSGWNGTPRGRDNSLELVNIDGEYITKPEVIHAELNCIMKAAEQGVSVLGSTMYITHSPCEHCAGMMVQCGIRKVIFSMYYKDEKGLDLLKHCGVHCMQLNF